MTEMLRKHIVMPIVLFGLSIAFIILCLILFVHKGNAAVLRKKLRIGGLLLALQAVAVQGAWPGARCYEGPAPRCALSESAPESGELVLNIKETNEIEAMVLDGLGIDFSFAVVGEDSVIQSGAVKPFDGRMDSREEKVTISLDPEKVLPGTYELRIFHGILGANTKILKVEPSKKYTLVVLNE
jgi:hypothetical protein